MKRKKKAALPRLTLLAYSRSDLQRLSDAAEQLITAAHDIDRALDRLEALVARSEAAKRANNTRKANRPAAALETSPEAQRLADWAQGARGDSTVPTNGTVKP